MGRPHGCGHRADRDGLVQLQERASSSDSLPSSVAGKGHDSDINSDQDKAKDCNGQVVPKITLQRSDTVIEVGASSAPAIPEGAHPHQPPEGTGLCPLRYGLGPTSLFGVPTLHPEVSPDHSLLSACCVIQSME